MPTTDAIDSITSKPIARPDQLFSSSLFVVGVIFVLGLILRLSLIDAYGLWSDEVESIVVARAGLPFILDSRFGWVGNQTVGYYLLVWSTIQPVDPVVTSALVRLPSALAGALLVLPVFGLGNLLFSRAAALLAALAVALSPILLDYSHDIRPYSLLAFFTAVSVYCLVMAERTAMVRWWVGFVIATVFNLLTSYMALIMILPSLAPYMAFILWSGWRQRNQRGSRHLLYAVISLAVVGAFAILTLLDMLSMSRSSPNLSQLSLSSLANVTVAILSSFTSIGLPGQVGSVVSLALALVAVLGVYACIRTNYGRGVFLCASVCLIASVLLAVLATASLISPRYVLFAAPFYFLLLGYGITSIHDLRLIANARIGRLITDATDAATNNRSHRLLRAVSLLMAGLLLALLGFGVYNYSNPKTHPSLSYRPDFRGAAAYLSREATPQDTIVMADNLPLGYNVTSFYLRDRPPAPMFEVRDPLLYKQSLGGSIFWVISSPSRNFAGQISNPELGWSEIVQLEGVIVLKDDSHAASILEAVDRMAARLEAMHPNYQLIQHTKGGVFQARRDVEGAAQAYRSAGMYFPLGNEYLRAAQGFARHGLKAEAWQQGLMAKAMEPYKPEIHTWLEEQLQAAGYADESRIEAQIAEALSDD